MEFLIIIEVLLAAALIGAVYYIRRLAARDKAAEEKRLSQNGD